MIRKEILGISLATQRARRAFVVAFWMVEGTLLFALFQFRMPPDIANWRTIVLLLVTLGVASNLPLLLGGFSLGGAVSFYEGRSKKLKVGRSDADPKKLRRIDVFVKAMRPVDEREAQLRDEAHHRAHRILFWLMYAGAVAYLVVSAISLSLVARFGFALLEFLLVASMSLPQSFLLCTLPEFNEWSEREHAS